MPPFISAVRKYLPLFAGLLILVVIALLAPWGSVGELLEKVPLSIFLLLGLLSMVYFLSKAFRFWYILQLLDIDKPIKKVMLLYLAGQPFAFLPAGELYRTVLLEKHAGVKISRSAPSVTIQGLVEAIILLSFSLVGAFIIGQNRLIVGGIALLLVLLLVTLRSGWLVNKHRFINKLPFVSVREDKYRNFIKGHQKLVSPSSLAILCGLSLIPVLAGIAILYLSVHGIDVELSFVEAAIGYTLPVILAGLSFLPGGIGVGEGGSIGLLHLFGISTAAAVTATLLVRAFTLVIGIVYGLIAALITQKVFRS
jgi:uncharacterized protein (TIRG00374 family)